MLVDTGSSVTVLSKDLFDKLEGGHLELCNVASRLVTADGGPLKIYGRNKLKISLGTHEFVQSVIIAEIGDISGILCIDFLSKNKSTFDIQEGVLRFPKFTHKLVREAKLTCARVYLAEVNEVPATSEVILEAEIRESFPDISEGYLEPLLGLRDKHKVLVPKAVFKLQGSKLLLTVLNPSKEPVKLHKNLQESGHANRHRLLVSGYSRRTGTTTITTSCHGFVSETLNITCTIDPHNSGTSIVLPDGTDAAACSAPLPNTICNQIPPYTTDYTKVGTKITFVLTIPSLDIDIHNGTWTCKHGLETTPLSPQGKEPTFTAIHTSAKSISLSGEVYCQHPVSAVTFEVLYAEQNGAYTTFNPQPSVSIQNLGSNGCSSQESNVSFSGILSCDNYTLAGKTFTLMARFNQSNLPPDSNTYNITSSGSFSCPVNPPDKGLSTGGVIGIVIGVLIFIIIVVVVVCICKHIKKASNMIIYSCIKLMIPYYIFNLSMMIMFVKQNCKLNCKTTNKNKHYSSKKNVFVKYC
ncbi:hypothetical protein KUTeg_005830 [Tegillarca granosa]|uniref:Peptidase A2 domain-containing protein n=1 Tax=Tegillarca granosa TaxID=220873 RepID=A0ABQ9FLL8_TEGGR|nr:hypothetical protein KUTeg_005830 [Tegillarca granosa]